MTGYKKPRLDYAVIQPPTPSETRRIMHAAAPHLRRAIELSWHTSLRPGAVELLSLTWRQVDFEARTILVISAKKGGPASRLVPIMHDDFFDKLKSRNRLDKQNGREYMIPYHGKPVLKSAVTSSCIYLNK